ncbi:MULTISPECIES: hypothetical protein [unclassified Nodularia (in: cyanobacteria)]|uniref:hypothetical protein n=1 Tax=unclassified Nodularia (in: cyanobacteria) TaxID=2656917 RepID=UPI001D11E67C|nr:MULTISPECIES: hypothetical protein [unclassified Nodularia (in: cyanobacteria)]
MKITYIDSGVLLCATNGVGRIAEKALEILGDSQREFASSEFVRLEVIPKRFITSKLKKLNFIKNFLAMLPTGRVI